MNQSNSATETNQSNGAVETPKIHAVHNNSLGIIYLATDGKALTGAWVEGQAHFATAEEMGTPIELAEQPLLAQAASELDEYLAGERTSFDVPIQPSGTDFQLAVWKALQDIPYGYTTTYGQISKIVGPHAPAQAVGQAVGRNRCLIFIPCHRVIAADGKITGYAAGVDTKQMLLDLEEPAEDKNTRLF